MRLGIASIVVCAVLTYGQMDVWRSPVRLWGHAVTVAPWNARAVLNYALALNGDLLWLMRAAELSETHPRGAEVRAIVRARLHWQTAFGDPVCSHPDVARYC